MLTFIKIYFIDISVDTDTEIDSLFYYAGGRFSAEALEVDRQHTGHSSFLDFGHRALSPGMFKVSEFTNT